jgi:purine catabolism regulator
MNLTVEEALRIYPLSRSRIVAGAEGAGRVIKSVNMMDAPDIADWVKHGEIIFTTAFAIKDTPEDFLRLLYKLNDLGAAGLGIKLGRYWNQIPQIVLDEANRLNFPLLELPYEFTFADQMNALVQAEIEKSTKKLHDALDKQKSLMRFAMEPGDSAEHFQRIGDILSHPIAVVGAGGHLLFNTSAWPEAEVLRDWPWNPKFDRTRTPRGWRYTVPLLQEGECIGFLLVMPEQTASIQEEEGLFHQAAEILSSHMDRFQDEFQSVSGYRWTLLLERCLQRKISPGQFLEQTRALGKEADSAAYLCVKTYPAADAPDEPGSGKPLRKIRRELIYHPYLAEIRGHHLFLDNCLVSLFTLPADCMPVSVFAKRIAASLEEALRTAAPGFRSFVSKPKLELAGVLEAFDECDHARSISERLGDSRAVTLFSDLELSHVFRHIPRETLCKYSGNVLGPLLDKQDRYAAEMLQTLEAYLENDGRINDAAKQLFVHRNTVLYRMEKISELLGVDLHKIGDLVQVKLALLFRRLAQAESDLRPDGR